MLGIQYSPYSCEQLLGVNKVLRLAEKDMMSLNNLSLESIKKTLKDFLVRSYKHASYRNLPQFKYRKYINNNKKTLKFTYLVLAT